MRGKKGINWDGGIRVPGIYYWPGHILPANVLSEPSGIVDIFPSVCGLLDISKPDGIHLDGTDISDFLTGRADHIQRHQPFFWHLQKSRPIVAVRDGRYSLVADPDYELSTNNMFDESWIPAIKAGNYTNYQLFDLEKDPRQQTNIADQNPELLLKLKRKLLNINASVMGDGADWHKTR